jgi:hypothetical protein
VEVRIPVELPYPFEKMVYEDYPKGEKYCITKRLMTFRFNEPPKDLNDYIDYLDDNWFNSDNSHRA